MNKKLSKLIKQDISRSKREIKQQHSPKIQAYYQGMRDYALKMEYVLKKIYKENK